MTQKRKLENDDYRKCKKRRKITFTVPSNIWQETISTTNISNLPDELLLHIFSYLSVSDLQSSVFPVCRKWDQVAGTSCLWHTIKAGPDVATPTVITWLETAGHRLKTLKLKRRNDAEEILKKVSRLNRGLENIKIVNCWGTTRQTCIPSVALCRVLQRCINITNIAILGCRFTSCKFFRILATKNHIRLTSNAQQRAISYTGDASYSQLREFLNTRRLINSRENADGGATGGNIALYRINDGVYEQIINDAHDLQQDHINRVLEAVYGQLY